MAPLEATIVNQCNAQTKKVEPREGTGKRQSGIYIRRWEFYPVAAVDVDGNDVALAGPSEASPSLHSTLERVLET